MGQVKARLTGDVELNCVNCGTPIGDDNFYIDDGGAFCVECIENNKVCRHEWVEKALFTTAYWKCKKCGKEKIRKQLWI